MPKINRVKTVPDLVAKELIALLSACSILILVSTFLDAPLGGPADPNALPMENVKAPWIFVGIQQMLRFLPPWLAGIFIPFMAILLLSGPPNAYQAKKTWFGHFLRNSCRGFNPDSMGIPELKTQSRIFFGALLGCFLIFVSALLIISYRQRNPEWKKYQLQGISLAISLLDDELANDPTVEKRRTIKTRIKELKNLQPRIIETSPFSGKAPSEFCMTCHFGIEDTSESHPNSVFGCVICHGGVGSDLTVKGAHRGIIGGANPARLDLASQSCGSGSLGPGMCHADKLSPILDRVRNTLVRSWPQMPASLEY